MMSVGMAAKANPTPNPTIVEMRITCQRAPWSTTARANAIVMITPPRMRLVRGPRVLESRAPTGDIKNMTSPSGMRARLETSRVWPSPTPVVVGASRRTGRAAVVMKKAKPTEMEARLVRSTGRLAATRRSTRASSVRSSMNPQPRSTTIPPIRSESVVGLAQPHSLPFETANRMPTRPTANPIAPKKSNRPPARSVLTGTTLATSAIARSASRVASQNR